MPDATDQIDGLLAAAILLTLVDEDSAVSLLAPLDADDVRRLGPAMLAVASASVTDIEKALDAFVQGCASATTFGGDSEARTRAILTQALGQGRARKVLPSTADPLGRLREVLRWMPATEIVRTLDQESPQAAALIVASLDPNVAASVVQQLEESLCFDILLRAARLDKVDPTAVDALCQDLENSAESETADELRVDTGGSLAKVVAKLPKDRSVRLLGLIRKRDRALAERVEDEMFEFADLASVPERDLSTLLRSIDAAVLATALRGVDASLADRLLGCLSARTAQSIRDDIAEGASVKRAEVIAAQRVIVTAARSMANEGTIQLATSGDDYV